jgi:hypothetical protein
MSPAELSPARPIGTYAEVRLDAQNAGSAPEPGNELAIRHADFEQMKAKMVSS